MTERVAVVPCLGDLVAALRDIRVIASMTERVAVVASLRDFVAELRN